MKVCWICGSKVNLQKFGGEHLCKECAKVIVG